MGNVQGAGLICHGVVKGSVLALTGGGGEMDRPERCPGNCGLSGLASIWWAGDV